jgi:DNA-binding phage protein
MKPGWGQFFMTQRGQVRVAFDSCSRAGALVVLGGPKMLNTGIAAAQRESVDRLSRALVESVNTARDVKLLRDEVKRAGSQSELARQKGIARSLINRVLKGERLPTSQLCRALGLEWVLVSRTPPSDSVADLDFIKKQEFVRILRIQINKAGSIAAWGRQFGIDRSHLSSVLHKRRAPDQRIIAALNLSEALVDANDPRLQRGGRPYFTTTRRQPHARWKKSPAFQCGALVVMKLKSAICQWKKLKRHTSEVVTVCTFLFDSMKMPLGTPVARWNSARVS